MIFLKRFKRFVILPNLFINRIKIGTTSNLQESKFALFQIKRDTTYEVSNIQTNRLCSPWITVKNKLLYIHIVEVADSDGAVDIRSINYTMRGNNKKERHIRIVISMYNSCEYQYQRFDSTTGITCELKITPQHKQSMKKHLSYNLIGKKHLLYNLIGNK